MIATILGLIDKVLGVVMLIANALKKPLTDKIDSEKAKLKEEMDKFKDTGRPPK